MKIGEFPKEEPKGPFLDIDYAFYVDLVDGVLTQIELDIDENHKICIQFDRLEGYKIISPYFLYIQTPLDNNGLNIESLDGIDHILNYSKKNFDKTKYLKIEKFFMEMI